MSISLTPLTAAVGAEVQGARVAHLTDAEFGQIRDAWNRHAVLLFRDQELGDDELLAFSRRFGELDRPPNQEGGRMSPPGYPEVYVVSNVLDDRGEPIGALGAGEAVWHTDMSYADTPPMMSLLYALEVPESGGNTWFSGMAAAWTALPDALKAKLAGRRVKHDGTYNSGGYLRQGVTPTDDPHSAPGAWHPAVCAHPETGVPALYLGRRRNAFVEGLSREESDALLDAVWVHVEQLRFAYEHRWRVGDLVLWDNRMTMHRRDAFDPGARRVMHRTQVRGTAPPTPYAWPGTGERVG